GGPRHIAPVPHRFPNRGLSRHCVKAWSGTILRRILRITKHSAPCCTIGHYRMKALLESLQPGEQDWHLAQAIDACRLPAHIAIIMDGNGRWANRRALPRVAGHKAGIGPVRATVEACARLG